MHMNSVAHRDIKP